MFVNFARVFFRIRNVFDGVVWIRQISQYIMLVLNGKPFQAKYTFFIARKLPATREFDINKEIEKGCSIMGSSKLK